MPEALLTSVVVVTSQLRNIGKTTESGLSPRIMVGEMLVNFVTNGEIIMLLIFVDR